MQEQEKQESIKKYLFSLPMEVSTIMELKLNGFNYREIGTLLDIPFTSVEFKTRRARKELKKILLKYCD